MSHCRTFFNACSKVISHKIVISVHLSQILSYQHFVPGAKCDKMFIASDFMPLKSTSGMGAVHTENTSVDMKLSNIST